METFCDLPPKDGPELKTLWDVFKDYKTELVLGNQSTRNKLLTYKSGKKNKKIKKYHATIAKIGDEVVGAVMVRELNDKELPDVSFLVVKKDYQGQGIAKGMLEELFSELAEKQKPIEALAIGPNTTQTGVIYYKYKLRNPEAFEILKKIEKPGDFGGGNDYQRKIHAEVNSLFAQIQLELPEGHTWKTGDVADNWTKKPDSEGSESALEALYNVFGNNYNEEMREYFKDTIAGNTDFFWSSIIRKVAEDEIQSS